MIQKEVAFRREPSGTVTVPTANSPSGVLPVGRMAIAGLRWWRRQSSPQPNGGFREINAAEAGCSENVIAAISSHKSL
jgi:hypothetical protein